MVEKFELKNTHEDQIKKSVHRTRILKLPHLNSLYQTTINVHDWLIISYFELANNMKLREIRIAQRLKKN